VSWQTAMATAAYSSDWTTTAFVHWLGSGSRRQRRSGLVSSATDSKFVYSIVFNSCSYSALFVPNLPRYYSAFFSHYKIPPTYSDRPVKIGLLFIQPLKIFHFVCRFFSFSAALIFTTYCPFKIIPLSQYIPPTHPPACLEKWVLSQHVG
jgi:hypothetical protein